MDSDEIFSRAFGTATLCIGEKREAVRLAFDHAGNKLLCARAGDIRNWGQAVASSKPIALRDVLLNANGCTWKTPLLDGLDIYRSGGGSQSVYHSYIGALSGDNTSVEVLEISKNGFHDFELDEELPLSWEFSGGLDLPRHVDVADEISFQSDGSRATLYGEGLKECELRTLLTAVSMASGKRAQPRYHLKGRNFRIYFGQNLSERKGRPIFYDVKDSFVDLHARIEGVRQVFMSVINYMENLDALQRRRIFNQVQLFASARQGGQISDIQFLSMMTFFEALDKSHSLDKVTLGRLLEINPESAYSIIKVRHDFAHGNCTVAESVQKNIDFLHSDFINYVFQDVSDDNSGINFFNFLMSKANEVALNMFECDIRAARHFV